MITGSVRIAEQICEVNRMDDLISRQAAIDAAMKDVSDKRTHDFNAGATRAANRIKLLPSVQPEQRWIPVTERLPDEDYWTGANFQYSADVLMTVYNAEDEETIIDYGHTADGSWYSDTTDGLVPPWWEVLAWMPLPEPYKEGEET